jgi:hypothetical protein
MAFAGLLRFAAATTLVVGVCSIGQAQNFENARPGQSSLVSAAEQKVVQQSKFCEAATRLSDGNVNNHAYYRCMQSQGDELHGREVDRTRLDKQWLQLLSRSAVWSTRDGCEEWARQQPPEPFAPGSEIWMHNTAWNICMERQGVFTSSKVQRREAPSYAAAAAEHQIVTVRQETFACRLAADYKQISNASVDESFKRAGNDPSRQADEMKKAERELVTANGSCRYFRLGEKVRAMQAQDRLLCAAPADDVNTCFWASAFSFDVW